MEVPHEQWRPISEIVDQFTAMGYQVRGIERSDSLHQVEAIDLTDYESKPMCIRYPAQRRLLGGTPRGAQRRAAEHEASGRTAPATGSQLSGSKGRLARWTRLSCQG
jgi:hypothetical protein